MATTPQLLSIERYLRTSYSPDADFVDGEIETRHMGERTHNFIQGFLFSLINANIATWHVEAVIEQRIRIDSSRVRVCDLTAISTEAPFEEVVTVPPVLCIEVMSSEDRLNRAELVVADYFAMGVPNIWLIDPIRRVAYTFGANGLKLADPASMTVSGTPIRIDVAEAFVQLDRKTGHRSE
jgi:Uma2 family endonuclease